MHDQFKYYLLNEQKYYLGQRAGDILTALQNLESDAPQMGNRALLRAAEGIVNQIRRILHGRWDDSDIQYLETLQKVGVAIMKAIEEKEEIEEVIASAGSEVQKMLNKLEVPINSIGSKSEPTPDDEDFTPENDEPLAPGSQLGA